MQKIYTHKGCKQLPCGQFLGVCGTWKNTILTQMKTMQMHSTPKDNNPTNQNNSWLLLKKAALPLAVAGTGVVAAPLILSAAGFGASGIVAGSLAAKGMSFIAAWNGVGVVAGSTFAACQSAGVVGIAGSTLTGIGVTAGTATAVVQEGIQRIGKKSKNEENIDGSEEDEQSENEDEKGSDELHI
ncbi:IF27A-like protein [Mya arenaria]|uniref:IF27A-like protein n=2 Tax=Mya arenaria TaxID=6604 RepID=A0ABY7DCZ1_MYAAR|nr:interferon alpha-inducible protein 27-like protein 2B isoform X1 [Mya arenaria]WAQ94622.1 IF27A-like protein [Mya arenaria]